MAVRMKRESNRDSLGGNDTKSTKWCDIFLILENLPNGVIFIVITTPFGRFDIFIDLFDSQHNEQQ